MYDLRGLLGDLYMNFAGSSVLLAGAVCGLVLVIEGIFDVGHGGSLALSGAWERIFGAFTGIAMILGFGGARLLYDRKNLTGRCRFWLKLAVFAAFMLLGPLVVVMKYSYFMTDWGFWAVVMISLCTLIPFGIALIRMIFEKRNSHS